MNYIIGLDVGIASIGYAIIRLDENNNPDKLVLLNSIIFPIAENEKGESYSSERGELRRSRRVIRRRKFRKKRIKNLFIRNKILSNSDIEDSLRDPKSVYDLRVKGLDHALSNKELFKVLYWFGGHRGFKSNRKSELKEKDMGLLLKSLNDTRSDLNISGYRTIGELYLKSSRFKDHKRNKFYDSGYTGSSYRDLIIDESNKILSFQSSVNDSINKHFIDDYIKILTSQRNFDEGPGVNSPYSGSQISKMIGMDSFNHDRVRAPKASFTFNYFTLLTRLNNIKIKNNKDNEYETLTSAQKKLIIYHAVNGTKTKYNQVRKWLDLPKDDEFNLVNYEKNNAESNTLLCDFSSVRNIRKCLTKEMADNNEVVDKISEILSIYKSDSIRTDELSKNISNISDESIDKLLMLNFSKFGRLSIDTMKEIIPYLENGETYDRAAIHAGYDYKKIKIDKKYIDENVTNPVVKRTVKKAIKLVEKIINRYGNPYEIHIELARELGKSKKERKEIERNQLNNQERNEEIANQIRELGFKVNGQNILKMKLYREQVGIDPYTKNSKNINISLALSGDDYYEIDHIIPYSKSFDDGYSNKILVSKKANQEKGNRIPMDYLKNDKESVDWLRIFANKLKNKKKRDLLLKTSLTDDEVSGWKRRNINDTRYINKILSNYFMQNISFSKEPHKKNVYPLNGAVTAKIRSRWGIVKNRNKSDIHHAIDAAVIGCITDSFIQKVTRFSKNNEIKYNSKLFENDESHKFKGQNEFKKFFNEFPLPYEHFRDEVIARTSANPKELMKNHDWNGKYTEDEINNVKPIITIRFPKKKTSGAIHKEGINSAKNLEQGIISRRVTLDKLKIKSGKILYDNYQYNCNKGNQLVWKKIYDALSKKEKLKEKMVDSDDKNKIKNSISDIFPNNTLEYESNGHINKVRKVRVEKQSDKGVLINKGHAIADNAKNSMFRIDVFKSEVKYVIVPIYKSDVSKKKLPDKIISSSSTSKFISNDDIFIFSLYRNDLIYVKFTKEIKAKNKYDKNETKVIDVLGYFVSCDSSDGRIIIQKYDNSFYVRVSMSSIAEFKKYQIDYFGNYYLVSEKKRQKLN